MVELPKTLDAKKFFFLILVFLIATNVAILLNIPFLRQILGFLFLTILPGLLILQILKLNKIGYTEKFVLSVGLSVSFLMFFGLLVNNLSLGLGYETPLSTISLLISFNIAFIVLSIVGYKINKNAVLSRPTLNLSTSEKAFLIVPIFFPALSIFGMHVMNTTNNNAVLTLLLFLIPVYVIFVCFFNQKFPKRIYPVVIFSIGISLLLLWALRSNHIIGDDIHAEYYFFQTTLNNLHWSTFGHTSLDACLCVSLLPTIYQSILNISPEFLFKNLYSFLFSISPLVVYIISKRHIGIFYAFLVSFFFMAQPMFLLTPSLARTNTAILFFALAIMVLFQRDISEFNKKLFFIIFAVSCIVSHYATTHIFFFVLLLTWIVIQISLKLTTRKKDPIAEESTLQVTHPSIPQSQLKNGTTITITFMALFFAMVFFWYSQLTVAPFDSGVYFAQETFRNLNQFFLLESRGGDVMIALGKDVLLIPERIKFVTYWLTIVFVVIGMLITLIKRKQMVSSPNLDNSQHRRVDLLESKIDAEYFVLLLACSAVLALSIALPFILVGYALNRLHFQMMTVLSMFLVIGGIALAKTLRLRPYRVILVILVLYFISTTGVVDQIFNCPVSINLNSKGPNYDYFYVHDQDSYAAKWLRDNGELEDTITYTDDEADRWLLSQAGITHSDDSSLFQKDKKIDGYIYLKYYNTVNGELLNPEGKRSNITEYQDKFIGKSKVYTAGGSEIYR